MAKIDRGTCELCRRNDVELTVHHLIPKEMGGTFQPTALLCRPCHKQIHAIYENQELAIRLYTIELLKEDEKIGAFLKWIKKQPSSKLVHTKKPNNRKRK
ncbi:HNH endonuclease [Fictibacillus iocasae]|uniref:HNH endonuclease n=1 Tax=Fictibacillus iocasae TaxID=2715437 RepID=A0ABW2NME6_9BACL